MNSLGPLLGVGLIIDWRLFLLVVMGSLVPIPPLMLWLFPKRRLIDRLFVALGLFLVLCTLSLVALHGLGQPTLRDMQVFIVD